MSEKCEFCGRFGARRVRIKCDHPQAGADGCLNSWLCKAHEKQAWEDSQKKTVPPQKDFTVENHGSIVLVRPLTEAAKEWLAEHTPRDADHQYWSGALVVEPRYLENLLEGIGGDGLSV